MRKPITLTIILGFLCLGVGNVTGANPGQIRWNNERTDTTRITSILIDTSAKGFKTPNQAVSYIAEKFIDTPYEASTLEGSPEMLTINLDKMDCTTLVETVAAMAITIIENRSSWQDFIYNLENIRYRQGKLDGYASRLHYISDWIVDNSHRGNIREMTARLPGASHQVKTIDFMSSHRDSYPALADSLEYARIKGVEIGYRSHRFPYIKSAVLMGKGAASIMQDGDIIAFTTKTEGLDVSHVGIIRVENGVVKLLHASSKAGKVLVDPLTLSEYLKRNRNITGGRIIRIDPR
ncbi:MAG: DUF1460 domain-containing protein [Duncaniella sp.]|nr:DUF1460 domain-containing protein [Duncaniella sp.]